MWRSRWMWRGCDVSAAQIHLNKTLCAMRWIALMTGNRLLAEHIERDMGASHEKL